MVPSFPLLLASLVNFAMAESANPTKSGEVNSAFVFVKPHANIPSVRAMVEEHFKLHNIRIVEEGTLDSKRIDEEKLIDKHYYAIASKATLLKPSELPIPETKFEEEFGENWSVVLQQNRVFNALDALKVLDLTPSELERIWRKARVVKFGGGFYCGKLSPSGLYVFNAFFMSMREAFVAPGASIHYYNVVFDPKVVPWESFRKEVIGSTNPTKASTGSLRGKILRQWEKLGLQDAPDVGNNGVHASASPFEGLTEKLNWLGAEVSKDPFGKALISAGLDSPTIAEWGLDPHLPGFGSVFDNLENLDFAACVDKLVEMKVKCSVGATGDTEPVQSNL